MGSRVRTIYTDEAYAECRDGQARCATNDEVPIGGLFSSAWDNDKGQLIHITARGQNNKGVRQRKHSTIARVSLLVIGNGATISQKDLRAGGADTIDTKVIVLFAGEVYRRTHKVESELDNVRTGPESDYVGPLR